VARVTTDGPGRRWTAEPRAGSHAAAMPAYLATPRQLATVHTRAHPYRGRTRSAATESVSPARSSKSSVPAAVHVPPMPSAPRSPAGRRQGARPAPAPSLAGRTVADNWTRSESRAPAPHRRVERLQSLTGPVVQQPLVRLPAPATRRYVDRLRSTSVLWSSSSFASHRLHGNSA
jgi:hypothetical protein